MQDEDGDPSVTPVYTIKVTNGTLTDNGDTSVSLVTGGGGGGGGDNVQVNSVAVDTTADFIDSIYEELTLTDGGAGGPDDVTSKPDYDQTLAGNPALEVDECIHFKDTSGGGFLCEGSTADTSEQLYRFPDVNGADTDENIVIGGGAFHDGFSDFVANEHIDHTSVTLTAGTNISGGGDISANRTFNVDDAFVINSGSDTMAGELTLNPGVLFIKEQAEASADVASFGQLWVNTAAPNELWFTDDAGTDVQLGVGGAETNSLETVTTGIATTEIPIGTAADTVVYAALSGDTTMTNGGVVTVVDDSHNHVIANIDSMTSAALAGQISDETGTGVATFATAPTFTTSITSTLVITDLIDPSGAVDLDIGSADVTDVTVVTDGGTVIIDGAMKILEKADADADVAGYGQVWVNTASPNELYFTDDDGTDFQLGVAGGSSKWTDSGALTYLTSLTDNIAIGTSAATTGKLEIQIDAGENLRGIHIDQDNISGTGLSIDSEGSDSTVISIDTPVTTIGGVINGDADSLTTGHWMRARSGSTDTSVRDLVIINNESSAAVNTTTLNIEQNANQNSVTISNGAADVVSISQAGVITSTGLTIGSAVVDETELEILDGATLTTTELNYVDGVTSAIQTQLDGKEGTLTNSAGLAAALSDETGTGVAVFGTAPTFTTSITSTLVITDLIDPSGAADLDIGSGDVTDVTVTTDGGVIILDGDITQDAGTTLFMGGLLDATGAVDMDYGSGDITDHTFISDGGTAIIDGTGTFAGASQSTITEGLVVNNAQGGDADDDFQVHGDVATNILHADASAEIVILDGAIDIGTVETFTDSDATPDVGGGSYWNTNTTSFTITDFDGAAIVDGQIIYVISKGAITYDVTTSGLKGGTTDLVTASGDLTSWLYDGTDWYLIQFTDQSDDLS